MTCFLSLFLIVVEVVIDVYYDFFKVLTKCSLGMKNIVDFPFSYSILFNKIVYIAQAIGLSVPVRDCQAGDIQLKSSISWTDFGMIINIHLQSVSKDKTVVEFSGKPVFGIDTYGKCKKIMNTIISLVNMPEFREESGQ